jgi:ATP-dependent RNA helicase DDX3X
MLRLGVIYGGIPIREQIGLLGKGYDLLVGAPGRLVDFIQRPKYLTLRRL